MFDAKHLLEMLMKGAQPQQAPAQSAGGGVGGLGDILGQILGGQHGQTAPAGQQGGGGLADILGKLQQAAGQGGAGGGLGDILGKVLGGGQQSAAPQPAPSPSQGGGSLGDMFGKALGRGQQADATPQRPAPSQQRSDADDDAAADAAARGGGAGGAAGGLEDILRKLQAQMGGSGGNLKDILGQVLGQATSGVAEGARRVDDATGASGQIKNATGQSPDEILAQLKNWVAQNQTGAAAGAAGLGAVVLGTHAGRALAGKAIKLGSLALIGGLAYKALQNYQAGRPLISPADAAHLSEAPQGTGYETAAVTHDSALLYIRAMIAAAAADGRIDATEQSKLLASMTQAGMGAGAEQFLANELNNPATPEELAAAVKTEQEAVQVFTAARLAVDVDEQENHDFLVALGTALGMDGKLMQHIDAAARGAA